MSYLPKAFEHPVWYVMMEVAGAKDLFTQKQYSDVLAERLNSDQRNAFIKVEEYTFLPSAIYLIIREVALTLEMWWPLFKDHTQTELNLVLPGFSWGAEVNERIGDEASFEHHSFEMLYLPVWKGYAMDPNGYPFNSINNKAGIEL